MVDVTHHGHHRRARLGIGGIVDDVEQAFLDVACCHALDGVAHFLGHQLRVSASITSVIFTIWPCFIKSRITSTARSACGWRVPG